MKTYPVVFKPEVEDHLDDLYEYIAEASSNAIARRYVEAIAAYCMTLSEFPFRGSSRDDVKPGLRTISYRSRALIVFNVEPDRVVVIGIYYGGQNWEAALSD